MEALGISRHVLQISITDTLLQDPLLKGSDHRSRRAKDGYLLAGTLETWEIAALEEKC